MKDATTIKVHLDTGDVAGRLRRAADALDGPTFGDRIEDGGVMGTIVRCDHCGGSGQLHDPDESPEAVTPTDG